MKNEKKSYLPLIFSLSLMFIACLQISLSLDYSAVQEDGSYLVPAPPEPTEDIDADKISPEKRNFDKLLILIFSLIAALILTIYSIVNLRKK